MQKQTRLESWMLGGLSIAVLEISDFTYMKLHWVHTGEGLAIVSFAIAGYLGLRTLTDRLGSRKPADPKSM